MGQIKCRGWCSYLNELSKYMNVKTVVLYLAKWAGVFAIFRRWTRDRPRILCYHGGSLEDEHLFNPKLFCPPGLLESRLQWLESKGFVPSSLNELVSPEADLPRHGTPVIVTLDDGWYSSATDLLPLLARYGYQPTLYLATQVFVKGIPVFDVCLRYLLWKSTLEAVTLRDFSPLLDGSYQLRKTVDRERFCVAADQWFACLTQDPDVTHAALERLANALGVSSDRLNLKSRRFSYMGAQDLLFAVRQGCQIELHGHTHLYVAGQPERNLVDIETCRQHICNLGLPMPRHYCYPSGAFDAYAAQLLMSANVLTATTCEPGLVRRSAGLSQFYLPRFLDGGDVTPIEFEAEMSGVLEFVRRLVRRG